MKQNKIEVALFEIERNIDDLNSLDDLEKVQKYLKAKRDQLASKNKYNLIIGQEVSIVGSGKVENGKIIKINRTRAVIDCFDESRQQWIHYNVPFSMIRTNLEA